MERNMLRGELGDRINTMLSAVGFNLVKLMKGLKRRWLKRLFSCLRTMADYIADAAAGLLRWVAASRCQASARPCRLPLAEDWLFA